MEKNVLNSYHTFDEYPDYNIEVTANSNYYYVETPDDNFIATKMVDKATIEKINNLDVIITNESYYNVINGLCVHQRASLYSIVDSMDLEMNDNVKIYHLSQILNIFGNKKSYLNIEDVNELINFNKPKQKIKK